MAGEPVTESMLNEQVRDNLLALAAAAAPGGVLSFMIPASEFQAVAGTPTFGPVGSTALSRIPAWAVDPASDEAVSALYYMPFDPAGVTMEASIIWAPATTNTGNCDWELQVADVAAGEQIDQAADETDSHLQAAGGVVDALQQTTPVALNRTGRLWRVVAYRDANDAVNDTFTGDAYFIGVLISVVLA